MAHGSMKAVLTAIASNAIVTAIKFVAAAVSGSAAMMNEAVHSLMDTLNQGFLLLGLRESTRPADQHYAFGHGQKKYLWNLWSAIGLFSIGSGLGLAHAWHSWHGLEGHAEHAGGVALFGIHIMPLTLNLLVLGIAFLLEGYSFLVAFRQYLTAMRQKGYRNPFRYLLKSDDPTLVAVVLEDSVAMLGLVFAALGVGLAALTGNTLWDILFSALIAIMLGIVAFYLGWTNMRFLADMRDMQAEAVFKEVVANHKEVERYHDLRSIIIDEHTTVLVGEVELKEEAIVPDLQASIDETRDEVLQKVDPQWRDAEDVRCYAEAWAAVQVTLMRAERIIDELEAAIKARCPQVAHITLEVEGISTPMAERLVEE